MITVRTNRNALRVQRAMGRSKGRLNEAFARLSTGQSVHQPKDDQARFNAGLRTGTKVRSSHYAIRNIASGVSIVQASEAGAREIQRDVQRIRELAVQAANGSLSDDDRFGLQVEARALVDEIDRTATATNSGGIKLLDGSTRSLNVMVGTQSGNVIRLDLRSLQTKDLGKMVREPGEDLDSSIGLIAGDLTINGYGIRGTTDTDDLYSSHDRSGSGIAKAKAINSQTEFTGVKAKALETFVLGDPIAGGTLDNANFISINGEKILGIDIESSDATGELVGAINALRSKTGVEAVVDEIGALTLTADDGRNIAIETSSIQASDATGLNFGSADFIVTGGALRLSSQNLIKLETSAADVNFAIGFGSVGGTTYLSHTDDTFLKTIEITSQDEANRTLEIVDSALETLRSQVSKMGALNSRLGYAMQNVSVEQLAAQQTRSTLIDADFAHEVVSLTRETIAQEAQTAFMSQANTSSESALTLLDGMASLGFNQQSSMAFSAISGGGIFSSGSKGGFSLFS